jgi:hypothetical protein
MAMKKRILVICAAVAICSAGTASAQKGPFMDDLIPAANVQIGRSLWAMGYTHLCPTLEVACGGLWLRIHPMDEVKVLGFAVDPATGSKYVRLKLNNGSTGFMEADWRTWVAKDPRQTKCRDVSPQIGWSDDTVLRAMKCAPDHINSTTTQMHDREQWVYSENYLYFEGWRTRLHSAPQLIHCRQECDFARCILPLVALWAAYRDAE